MKKEETIDFNIKAAWHAIYRMYNQEASQHGITTTIGFVLLNLDPEAGTPVMKIAPMLGMEARSLTRILKSMQEKGLIVKRKDIIDKRSIRIHLTAKGRGKKEIARQTVKNFNRVVRENVSEEKLSHFFHVLRKINQLVENNHFYQNLNHT